MLRIENLTVGTLPPLSFTVADGEIMTVEGPSGSGKTRLLRAIADLDPAPGHIYLDGLEQSQMPAALWRSGVRYIAAEPGWWTDTPRDSFPEDDIDPSSLLKLCQAVGLDPMLLDRPVTLLSTGERQRFAFVRGLYDHPQVLLLDEPTGPLDPGSTALVEKLMRQQADAGCSIVLVSHDRAQIERLADAQLQLAAPGSHTSSATNDVSPAPADQEATPGMSQMQ